MKRETIDKITAPFSNVREKEGPWDSKKKERIILKYIPGTDVIERLNEIFEYDWSFQVLDQRIIEDQVIVHGRLTVTDDESGSMVQKENFGSSIIKRYSSGQNEGKPIDLGFDFKGAATDCIKKCSTMVGVALRIEDMESVSDVKKYDPKPKTTKTSEEVQTKKAETSMKQNEISPDDFPPLDEDLDIPVDFPKEKKLKDRPQRPKYSGSALAKPIEPSKTIKTPQPTGNRVDSEGMSINANQLSVLKSMVIRKGMGENEIIEQALAGNESPPETFEELTREEARVVLSLAYQLDDVPPGS